MPINGRGVPKTDPVRNFRFIAQFLPLGSGPDSMDSTFRPVVGFTSISGLTITTESIPYREGGYNTSVHQVPGQTSFSPITFQRGVILGTDQNWKWMRQLFRVIEGGGSTTNFRCDIVISVMHHPMPKSAATSIVPQSVGAGYNYPGAGGASVKDDLQDVAMQFRVYNAWPTSVAYSDLNAGDNAIMVEQLTVVHEGFNLAIADNVGRSAKVPVQ